MKAHRDCRHKAVNERRGRRRHRHIDRFVPFDLRQVGGERGEEGKRAGRRAIIRNSKEIGGGGDVCEEGDPVRFVRFRFLLLISNLFTTRASSRIVPTLLDMGYTEENAKQTRCFVVDVLGRSPPSHLPPLSVS